MKSALVLLTVKSMLLMPPINGQQLILLPAVLAHQMSSSLLMMVRLLLMLTTNVTAIEKLITGNGTNSLSLGTKADDAGLKTVTGGSGADTINATGFASGGNTLEISSGGGIDTITGATSGSTVIYGGAAVDVITGGGSADKFKYSSTTEMGSSLNSAETITSFTDTSDKIWLAWAGIDFDEDITVSDNGVNTTIQINKDGAADGYLQLVGISDSSVITSADFQFGELYISLAEAFSS